ncbi:T9SS type A sorting domain-containing protein [bacterium]|nr:T9SS type A sorting domain-containing protein [bacterium]
MKQNGRFFYRVGYIALLMAFIIGQTVFALPEADRGTFSSNPGDQRGPVVTLDDQCTWDYDGMRFLGTGGISRGTTMWPNGSYGGNYGEMRFVRTCDLLVDTAYAFCFDIDHALENEPYCVDVDSAVITEDSCSAAQLKATAYLLAWGDAQNAFEDDVDQLAIWKLTTNKKLGSPTYGIPYFCINWPNLIDPTPSYPYINTVFSTNSDRNNAANLKVLDALDKNVMLEDDQLLVSNDPAVVGPEYSVVTVQACVYRGARAGEVGNTSLEGIRIIATYKITSSGTPHELELFTDASGCVSFDISQSVSGNAYDSVFVEFCSNACWPMNGIPCDLDDKQDIVFGDPIEICEELPIPGDTWLPVELTAFHAFSSEEGVDLVWTTASEIELDYWEIERCNSGTDDFTVLARLQAHNSLTGSSYTYFDRLGIVGRVYDYRLVDVGMDGTRTVHESVESASYGNIAAGRITEYELDDAYPNPFNPSTTIRYSIPEDGLVNITVYDVSGREVAQIVNTFHEAGRYAVNFNGANLSSGTYFYRMTSSEFSMTKRIMLLK